MTKRQVAQHKPGTTMAIMAIGGGPLPRSRTIKPQGGLAGLLAGVSVSAAALALATLPQQARAQSAVNATPTGINATVTQSATFDQVTVTGSQATVDWALNPTGVSTGVFLNGGTQLDFQGSGSYTVLNRVNPMTLTGTLALNGNVTSSPQGKIWFYNPGGWVVGAGASIDVGSLVLTSSPITEGTFDPGNPNTTGLYGANGQIRFGQATAGSSVTNNGTISARNDGSYIALVAPRVVQAGSVTTNGTTAYVAAGTADLTINNGLFDIVVTTGTDDTQGVVHTGSTERFSFNSSSATPQAIYLVAVPKNDAMTMLVSGNIGFNSASSASQSGGKIVLSAGYDVVGGQPVAGAVAPAGNIALAQLSLQTTAQANAAGNIRISADLNGAVFASDDLTLDAGKRIDVVAFGEGGVFVNGALALDAGAGKTGGIIDIAVDGGAVFGVGGTFTANADGIGAIQKDGEVLTPGAAGEAATGGSVKIALADAVYNVGGRTLLSASAQGGLGGASAGSAQAGSVSFSSTALTALSPNTPLDLQASADAVPPQFGATPTIGASATGGSVDLAFGGSFVANSIVASANGQANPGTNNAAQNANGGSVSLAFSGSGSTVNIGKVDLSTRATAANGGLAPGGSLLFRIDGATINAPVPRNNCDGPCPQESVNLSLANFRDGSGPTAGSIGFEVSNGGTLDLAGPFSSINLFSSASTDTGGAATGAAISFTVDGGTVNVDGSSLFGPSFSIRSEGEGGFDGPLSNGRGGDITVTLRNGGSISAGSGFSLASTGLGGSGEQAGDGTGGTVLLDIANGTLNARFVEVGSFGFAGSEFGGGTRTGTGVGGNAAIRLTDPAAFLSTSFLAVSAPGQAGRGRQTLAFAPLAISGANGGNGEGGIASITINAGTISAGNGLTVDATGTGGGGFSGGTGGSGIGGDAIVTVNGGSVSASQFTVSADGHGGRGGSNDTETNTLAGDGGAGTGGNASVLLGGGNLTVNSLAISATGNANIPFGEGNFFDNGRGGTTFGDGPETAGKGGDGEGGTTELSVTGGSLANISGAPVRSISLDSRGVGGRGGDTVSNTSASQLTRGSGGVGQGGTATFILGSSADFEALRLDASGSGGQSGREFGDVSGIPSVGGNGGSGTGGDATITLNAPISAFTNFESTRLYTVNVGGQGASGGDGAIGGIGGAGSGGTAQFAVTSPDVFVNQLSLDAFGGGGSGGSGLVAGDGGAGGAGKGGAAELSASGAGVAFTAINGSLYVEGQGGRGGTGGSGDSVLLDAAGDGGNAGAGTGGIVRFSAINGATLDLGQTTEFDIAANGFGGTGGDGGFASTAIGDGGNGGAGTGGGFEVTATNGTVKLGSLAAGISGTGGNGGGFVFQESSSSDAFNGGDGGAGFGGNFSLTASGASGSIQANSLDIRVDGIGGSGIDAQGFDPVTFVGASGGAGGAGTGGTIRLDAFDQGAISITGDSLTTLTAEGRAAFGGVGANGGTNPMTGVGGAGGRGGNSGQGNGGTVILNAEGGLIEAGDITVFVNGYGASGADGGAGGIGIVPPGSPEGTPPAPDGSFGNGGFGGGGVGGAVYITAQRDEGGAVGGLDLGAVNLDVTGFFDFGRFVVTDASGLVEIEDRVDESNGGVNFASLDVQGRGNAFVNPITLSIFSSEAPIRVGDFVSASTGGLIDIVAIGTGGLDVTNQLSLQSDSSIRIVGSQGGLIQAGNIFLGSFGTTLISAQNCGVSLCRTVLADGQLFASTGGDFVLDGPALVEAGGSIEIDARGSVTGGAGSGYQAPGIFIAAANNATIRNASGGSLRAEAGVVPFGEGSSFSNGTLTLGEVAGGGIFDLSGNLSGVAGTSVEVTAITRIDTGGTIELVAGDDIRIGSGATLTNTTGGSEPGFIRLAAGGLFTDATFPMGNVASLLIGSGAVVDGTGGSVTLSGGAIDARGATVRGAAFSADVINPPAPGVTQRNDNGQLSAPCLEGDICLGTIAATGPVRIGQGDSAPVHFVGFGNIAGNSVAITSRDALTFGATASPFTITSAGPISLASQAGDLALVGNALIDGGTVALSAAGSVTGNGRLRSAGDIGINVGANITLASLIAARQLTTVAGIGGALEGLYAIPGSLRIGTFQVAAPTAIRAGGSIVIDSATTGGNDLELFATDLVSLGTDSNVANLRLVGRDVAFATLDASGNIVLSAGNTIAGTSAIAGGTLTATGATLNATTLRSGGAMSLTTSGAANLATATSGANLTISTGALTFSGLTSTGATRIAASAVTGGDIAAGTTLTVATPGAVRLGTATAGGTLTLGGATIGATTLRSGGATALTSSGATTLGSANAGTSFTSNSGALQFAGITAANDVAVTASSAAGGDVTSTAGAISLTTSGAATVGQFRAATDITAQATTLTFAGIDAGRNVTIEVTTLGGTAISAGQDLTIHSINDLSFGTIAAGRNLSLSASQGAITVNTDIDAGGTVALAGDAILVKAVGPLTVSSVSADNGDIAISTDGLLRVSSATSRGDVTLTSTANSLILGPIVAGRALAVPTALNASGTSKGTPGPGAITLSAAQSITMQATVDALTTLAATAGTLIDQRSLAVGRTIAYRSADLTLGQTAALGQSNFTTGIALTNTGSAGALLGDVAGTTAGYRLDNAEFARIHSGGDVSLAAGSSLTVGTLSASAASGSNGVADGNIGATSTLALSTSGDLSVGGALALGNAAGNTLRLSSGSLTLDAGAGSVRLVEGSGHGGTLAIATGELSALTSAARSAIVGLDGNAINLRLAQNDGVSDGRTLLEAGSIAISASGRVLIQNTAIGQTFDARRGFVADTFSISTSGSTQSTTTTGTPLIVINGTVAGQTGLIALRAVQVSGGFDDLSTVNGCRLFTATCGTPQFTPIQDVVEEEIGRGSNLDSGDAIGEGMLILIERFEPVGFEAVIDEPVTGSGNDDFLVPEAGTGDQRCEDDDKTKCDKPPAG